MAPAGGGSADEARPVSSAGGVGDAARLAWPKVAEDVAYDGWRRVLRRRFEMPDGSVGTYDVKDEAPVVSCVAVTEAGDILLVRQFRPGPELVLLELPAGAVEPGEAPADAMRRELLEETGYEAGELQAMGAVLDCAYSTRVRFDFVAMGCRRVAAPAPGPGEWIEVVPMPPEEFVELLWSGRLTDAAAGFRGAARLGLLAGGSTALGSSA